MCPSDLLLLDEPTVGLDVATVGVLARLQLTAHRFGGQIRLRQTGLSAGSSDPTNTGCSEGGAVETSVAIRYRG